MRTNSTSLANNMTSFPVTAYKHEAANQVNHKPEDQSEALRSKNDDLLSSFSYASRIINAMLPGIEDMHAVVESSFLIHRPKDVIGGDFYFYCPTENGYVVAVADCTGHGIPGALLSMIGYHLLSDIVKRQGLTRPGEILGQLSKSIVQSLHKDKAGNTLRDGMEISLCYVNTKEQYMEFAGANQSLRFFTSSRMIEIKGDKHTIGEDACNCTHSYSTHRIEFRKGDRFYLSSDGFYDQFGGPSERRLMKKNFTALLKLANALPLNEQQDFLEKQLDAWKGNAEQTDDILLVGVQL